METCEWPRSRNPGRAYDLYSEDNLCKCYSNSIMANELALGWRGQIPTQTWDLMGYWANRLRCPFDVLLGILGKSRGHEACSATVAVFTNKDNTALTDMSLRSSEPATKKTRRSPSAARRAGRAAAASVMPPPPGLAAAAQEPVPTHSPMPTRKCPRLPASASSQVLPPHCQCRFVQHRVIRRRLPAKCWSGQSAASGRAAGSCANGA